MTHRIKYSLAHQSPAKQELIVIEFARRHIDAGDIREMLDDVLLQLIEISRQSDLNASYTQRKTDRNVTHLIFTFSPKEEPKPTLPISAIKFAETAKIFP